MNNPTNPDTIENEMVNCPHCGGTVPRMKFCISCGRPLDEGLAAVSAPTLQENRSENTVGSLFTNGFPPGTAGWNPSSVPPQAAPVEEEEAEDDRGLTILVDYCRKTLATVGGDGYDEIILYQNGETGALSIHTYSKYVYMKKEKHRSYKVKEGAKEAAFQLIQDLQLAAYKDRSGFGLTGGQYVVKFREGDDLIRISTDNMGVEGAGVLPMVGRLLHAYIVPKED